MYRPPPKGEIFIKQYFIKFPNKYIQCDIKKQFGISRKFYITYILIDKYRSFENYSWITIKKIFEFYGYKTCKHKPKTFYEILDILEYMIKEEMIEIVQDLDNISYDTGIEIKINSSKFDAPANFTKLTSHQLDYIWYSETSLNKENILIAFLYINSYIGCRKRKEDGTEFDDASNYPEACWQSLDNMAQNLGMSKATMNQCIDYLTSELEPLLIREKFYGIDEDNFQYNAPSIYVLNKEGYKKEVKWAIQKMKEIYNKK